MMDAALNNRLVLLDLDTANTNYFLPPTFVNQRALRDSHYFYTQYPDYLPPKMDLNDIEINATPTNPTSPNGETLFEMYLWIKDTSDYPGHASGFNHLTYTLRDPQGLETTVTYQPNTFYRIQPDSSIFGWRRYRFSHILPAGSPPGIWGVSSIVLQDKARNKKYYSFVEFVRFDVEGSSILQRDPYLNLVGGVVNSNNAPTATFNIGCDSCAGQYYRLKVYSSMGGAVPIFTGQLTADTIQLSNLNLVGVNDGNLHATLFILDSTQALIGLKRATYIKDTGKPIATVSRTSSNGRSNIYNITTNENVTNSTIAFTDVVISGGVLLNVERITQRNFRLEIERDCQDTLIVSIRSNALSDAAGNRNDSTFSIIVDPIAPNASLSIINSTQCLTGNLFAFTNSSSTSSGVLTYLWRFGNGNTSTISSPTYTYTSAGTYSVVLIATNDINCADSVTQQVVVNLMPATSYTINTAAQCLTGNSFSFTNSSAIASGTLTHLWSFGDGGTATTLNTTKTYSSAGTYLVKLVSTSNNGCKDSTTQQVVVNPMPSTAYSINSAAQCLTGNSFSFTNSSSISSGTLSHLWTFGDGGTTTTLNATKTYSSAGTYSVKLVSTSNNGCKDSTTRQVTVHPMPIAGFTVTPAIQCLTGNSFSFTNSSTVSGGTTTSNWTFGNGSTSTNQNPTNSYTNVGTYTVKLISTSNNGCKDSTTRDVRVDPSPTATLAISPYRSIHPGLLTTISATVTPAGNYKYTWYRDNQLVPTETTAIVDSIGYRLWSGAYKMTVENLSPLLACAYTTTDLIVGDSVSTKLFIYPNPSNGLFRVTYYSPTNTRYQVVVVDTKGAVLYRKPHEVTNRYQLIDINLTGTSRGLYILQIQDPTGKQLATGKLVIQ
jgi:PKD repeat protein